MEVFAPIPWNPELMLRLGCIILALASIADLSILELSSRTAKARQSWSVILKVQIQET